MIHVEPIRVFARDGQWVVDYGWDAKADVPVRGYHDTRSAAIETATRSALYEHREFVMEAAGSHL
jgi:hypothetical protein